jgi:hypothetical protein
MKRMNTGHLQTERHVAALHPPDHADGCACDACMPGEPLPELILVGLPHLSDVNNGFARAKAEDGEVLVSIHGFGLGELSMPKAEATALRDQLNAALSQL